MHSFYPTEYPMLKKIFPFLLFMPTFVMAQSYVVYDFTHNKVLESGAPNTVRPNCLGHKIK